MTWDDFRGIPQPFSSYGAAISSTVYLEYDSSTSHHFAYAGQNDIGSWTKPDQSDYALNHEQYHFNITEVHARLLNKYITDNPGSSKNIYGLQLEKVRTELSLMQSKYDRETNHSTIIDKQRRWEYRIDSLLTLDSGWVTDQFSGAKIYFPAEPEISKGKLNDEIWHRTYSLRKYGTNLTITSYQYRLAEIDLIKSDLKNTYNNEFYKSMSLKFDTVDFPLEAMVYSRDTANHSYINRWIYNHDYLYQISVNYTSNEEDTTGYDQIAKSFINSFSIENTNDFWFDKLEKSTTPILLKTITPTKKKENTKGNCIWQGASAQRGLFRGPFFRDDGALFLAFDAIEHSDSLLSKNLLIIDNDLYSYEPETTGQLFYVPKDGLPKGTFYLDFGYFLKNDSIRDCDLLYYQSIPVKLPTE